MSQSNGSKQQPSFGCGKNGCGRNGALCPTCGDSYMASTTIKCPNGNLNPKVPTTVVFQRDVGPRQGDLCALTPDAVQGSVHIFRCVFLSMVLPLIPVESRVLDSHVGLWRGCEWSSGNCWLVVILQMFQTGRWHTSINVSNPLGYALWILVHELRTRGFVPRQKLQAFRILMAEIIGQHERGTLFENGQMDPHEVLKMLEDAGAFRYDYRLSSERVIEGIHATPVIDLVMSQSSSRTLIEKLAELKINIVFDQQSKFSSLPQFFVVRVSSSERMYGSTVDFPLNAVFDFGPLTFRITLVMIIIDGHYLTVFIRLKYNPQTETVYTTYWLSDSKSDVRDCGHHVPSIVEIDQRRFDELWRHHAISIACIRIRNIVHIDGNPHELNGANFKPLKPAGDSLPECDNGQYAILGPNGEIRIKQCMSPLEFQRTFSPPPQQAPRAQVAQVLTSVVQRPIIVEKLTFADITIHDREWSIRRGSFFKEGTCVVCQDQYMHGNALYSQAQLILLLNILYQQCKSE